VRRAAVLLLLAAGCVPRFDDDPALLQGPRLIAVVVQPPEAAPGQPVMLRAVAAGPEGLIPAPAVRWSVCTAPTPPVETGSISPACLGDLPAAGPDGETLSLSLPLDGCARFGPDTPPGDFRPRDPDGTGGFYQPVRADWSGQTAFAFVRLACGAGRVAVDVALEFRARYIENQAPRPADLTVGPEALTVHWPPGTREAYARVDPVSGSVVEDVESLTVSWFVTAGEVASARTTGDDGSAQVRWLAPPGPASVFAVVRDSRGGSAVLAGP
jgi:hypothetical protein